MKIISICGTHGVGKTTLIEKMKEENPDYLYIQESTRVIMPNLGYDNPYDFVDEFGIAFYESIIMGTWSILTKTKELPYENVILDRSPIDNLAYYYLLRKTSEYCFEKPLERLCRYYCGFIDRFIMIPSGVFKLNPDAMQVVETQEELERIMLYIFKKLQLEYYLITKTDVVGRLNEIKDMICF